MAEEEEILEDLEAAEAKGKKNPMVMIIGIIVGFSPPERRRFAIAGKDLPLLSKPTSDIPKNLPVSNSGSLAQITYKRKKNARGRISPNIFYF